MNIFAIFSTKGVLKLKRFNSCNDSQEANIEDISVTFLVSKFFMFKL